ncbi:YciI family protein [Actomonas aquatica]|uniref:YciI family protein n=1 Tax=Actomonas aquatica TaxID=2866162 RepID=A0ABZ1C7L2_9BACT|nr:YciI family protein [Opitutus sp. WL0086]WRQ87451.1 YciI family protein [Opitutus sp. WL0086]
MSHPHLLLFRNTGPETHAHLSADERQDLIERWNAWFVGLRDAGKALDGRPLELSGRLVSGPGGKRVTDGPFAESNEAVGGYVLLNVADLDEATAIAQQHPGLEHGLIIEVRPMPPTCHLGVVTGPA